MSQRAEDHEDIRQLLARYNWAIDFGETEAWADCFVDEGVFTCLGLPEGAPTGGTHEGRDALLAYAESHFAVSRGRARHWNWNLLIDVDGDEATMQCYLNAQSAGRGESAVLRATGLYRDQLRRTDGGWRFVSREVTVDPA